MKKKEDKDEELQDISFPPDEFDKELRAYLFNYFSSEKDFKLTKENISIQRKPVPGRKLNEHYDLYRDVELSDGEEGYSYTVEVKISFQDSEHDHVKPLHHDKRLYHIVVVFPKGSPYTPLKVEATDDGYRWVDGKKRREEHFETICSLIASIVKDTAGNVSGARLTMDR